MSDVRLNNICKVYDSRDKGRGGVLAVKNFSMDIQDGEFIVFVGPSGCGKSTTLRMIAGLEDISSGDLYIGGTYVNDVPAKDRNIAMVFQNYALYPHMTAYQNISFGLTLQKVQDPVYEMNEEVAPVLAEIAALKREFALIGKKNSADEKKIDAIEKNKAGYVKSVEALERRINRLKNIGMQHGFVRTLVARAERRIELLKQATEESSAQIAGILAGINENKARAAEIKEEIGRKTQSIAGHQLKQIDKKKLAELKKSIAYYRRLAASDESIRKKDEKALKKLEEKLAPLQMVQDPVYEMIEEVAPVLAEIAALKREFALIGKKNSADEKKIDAIEKSKAGCVKSVEALERRINRLKNIGMQHGFVRTLVARAERRIELLKQATEESSAQIAGILAGINENKARTAEIKEEIGRKTQSIAGHQLKQIDKKKLAKLKKLIAYYRRLAASDGAIRKKDVKALKKLEEKLAPLQMGGELSEEETFRAEGYRELIRRYREELEILEQRKLSIEQNIARSEEETEQYSQTPMPVFRSRHYTKAEINDKVMRAAEILDIKKLLRRKPREMSGGQRQRIALGRAIVREPKVFLLDEPLSNLDAKLRTSMRSEIVKLHKQLNTTFIYVTHDQVEAMTMGTRIVVMKDGEVQQIDTPVNLFDYPVNTFVAGFIGTPQMNMFDVDMQACGDKLKFTFRDGDELSFEKAKVREIREEYLDGRVHRVVMGIRCENLCLAEKGKGFRCVASGIELLGSETNIYTSVEGVNITLKLNYRPNVIIGDEIYVGVDERKLYLFDSVTTNTILK